MEEMLKQVKIPKIGEIVEGKVIGRGSNSLFVDLGNLGIGVIYGREFLNAKEELRKLNVGDKILAKIIEVENEDGYIELSVSGIIKDAAFQKLKEIREKGEIVKVRVVGANRGGLICDVNGFLGFLPVFNMDKESITISPEDNREKILRELKKFIGKEIDVKIVSLSKDEIILSRKNILDEQKLYMEDLKEGEVIYGLVSALTSFGAFLKFGALEGLIPFSELSEKKLKPGDRIKAKIAKISNNKIFLSLT